MPAPHDVPSGAFECAHPVAGAHESVVHALPSSQLTAVPPLHAHDASYVSPLVHASPSSHGAPTVHDPGFGADGVQGMVEDDHAPPLGCRPKHCPAAVD